jgi:hypothetical protein
MEGGGGGGGVVINVCKSVKFINKEFGEENDVNILQGHIRYVLYKHEAHYPINVQSYVS